MESEKVKEIKKALASSFCSDIDYVVNIDGEPTMKRLWLRSVINLINELESENKELLEENESLNGSWKMQLKKIAELEKENTRLSNRITCQIVLPDEKLEEIKKECLAKVELAKGELLKQFAERLKSKDCSVPVHKGFILIEDHAIDETLKEFI